MTVLNLMFHAFLIIKFIIETSAGKKKQTRSLYLQYTYANEHVQSLTLHCKKRLLFFLSPARMSLTKLSLAGNNLIIPDLEEFGL
jgi:hypothetical protein